MPADYELAEYVRVFNIYKDEIKNANNLKDKDRAYQNLSRCINSFFGRKIDHELFDIMLHDAVRLIVNSTTDIVPDLLTGEKDGYVEAFVKADAKYPDEVSGSITKIIEKDGIVNGCNLSYKKGEIERNYNLYNNTLCVTMNINGVRFTKKAYVFFDCLMYEVTIAVGDNASATILRANELDAQDIINVYIEQSGNPEIKLLFPEIYDRTPAKSNSTTRARI